MPMHESGRSVGSVNDHGSQFRFSRWRPASSFHRTHRADGGGEKIISDDIKEIFAEAKGTGFDVKVLRQIIRIRKQDANERLEQEALLDMYMSALGMMPLFEGRGDE